MNKTLQLALSISALLIGVSVFYYFVISQNKNTQCNQKLSDDFERKFEINIKSRSFYNPGLNFLFPQISYNRKLKTCLVRVGYQYDDHGGRSLDLFIYNINTNSSILRGSDGVRYYNEGGSYYVDPKKENIFTIEEFNNKAGDLMGN